LVVYFNYFFTRFLVSGIFILVIIAFPLDLASYILLILGIFFISVISFVVAKKRQLNPYLGILEHLAIAISVIIISRFLGYWIISKYS